MKDGSGPGQQFVDLAMQQGLAARPVTRSQRMSVKINLDDVVAGEKAFAAATARDGDCVLVEAHA